MITRGFLINLGVTVLVSTLLFLYFRHRFKQTEHKVNTIFQLVQNHTQSMPAPPTIQFQEKNELISVSDDEGDSDSEEDSDSDSGDESERENRSPQEIFLGVGQIKQVAVSLAPDTHLAHSFGSPNLSEANDDLDDVGSLSSNDEANNGVNDETKNETNDEVTNVINIVKTIGEETVAQEECEESATDYSKLTVAVLKELAANKGFTNFRKLRKQALVELLSN